MSNTNQRRNFLKNAAALATLVGLPTTRNYAKADAFELAEAASQMMPAFGKPIFGLKVAPIKQVRVAVIGLGNRGEEHVRLLNAVGTRSAKSLQSATFGMK